MLGADPLKPVTSPDGQRPQRWSFPSLNRVPGADPTWADTLDSLRERSQTDQIALGMAKGGRSSVRSFSRIRAISMRKSFIFTLSIVSFAGFWAGLSRRDSSTTLARACAIARGRCDSARCVLRPSIAFGGDAARLHDELIAVTARWYEADTRRNAAPTLCPGRSSNRRFVC